MSDEGIAEIDPNDFFALEQRSAQARAIQSLDEDPEQASRADALSRATGMHPALVQGDLENIDKQVKTDLTGQIVNDNHFIQDYINSHPLAAGISSDDYGQLDAVSASVSKMGRRSVLGAAVEGFKEGFGEDAPGSWMVKNEKDLEWVRQNRLTAAILSTFAGPLEFALRLPGGVIKGASQAAGEATAQLTGSRDAGSDVEHHVHGMATTAMDFFMGHAAQFPHLPIKEHNAELIRQVAEANKDIVDAFNAAEPYLRAGVEPPVGVHPVIDKVKVDQAKRDADNLKDALKEAQTSQTRERSPDLFADFIRQHTEASIWINSEAVYELYKDKPPAMDDGKLGWVPRIAEQLETARGAGGDIEIPLADWLAKVDPQVANELHDHIRVRAQGLTVEEAKNLPEIKKLQDEANLAKTQEEIPLDLYHGTTKTFEKLSPDFATSKYEQAVFFSDRPDVANDYASGEGGRVYRASVNRDTLYKPTEQEIEQFMFKGDFVQGAIDKAKSLGKGGVHFDLDGENVFAIFDKNTIKYRYQALEAVRNQASLKPLFQEPPKGWDTVEPEVHPKLTTEERLLQVQEDRNLTGGEWHEIGREWYAYIKPLEELTEHELEVMDAVNEQVKRLAPQHLGKVVPAHAIVTPHSQPQGVYMSYKKNLPIIAWSFAADDPVGTARHEVLHFLKGYGFLTKDEWSQLEHLATENKWLEKHGIESRYPNIDRASKIEESVAEEFKKWDTLTAEEQAAHPVQKLFEKIKEILEAFVQLAKGILKIEPEIKNIFERIESGEVGARQGTKPLHPDDFQPKAQEKQLELDVTRQEDKKLFDKAAAIGMTVPQYKRYQQLIEKRNAEDIQVQLDRAVKEEKLRQTKEWKEEAAKVKDEVKADIEGRPDIAAAVFFKEGILYGDKVKGQPKLRTDLLTEEQRKALPEAFQGPKGMHPDDVANLFGYQSGSQLIDRLSVFELSRGEDSFNVYLNKIIDSEVERRMQNRHGNLAENILAEAKDHVISDTQMDLLHEETVALGMRAGSEMPFTKDEIKAWVAKEFSTMQAKGISTDKFLNASGRLGRAAELALLKDDPTEAFRQKQAQYLQMQFANNAKKFEKEQKKFDKTAKRFSKRQVPSVEQEYTNVIHKLLVEAGLPVRRSVQDIDATLAMDGYKSLDSFVESKVVDGWELDVADYIQAGQIKNIDQMSVGEFRDFKEGIESLAYVGREVRKIEVAGEKLDFEVFKKEVLANITELPVRAKEKQRRLLFRADAELTRMEEIVKDLDLRKQLGPLFNAVIRPMMDAKHKEYTLQEKLSKRLSEIKSHSKDWQKTLNESIAQDFFTDPYDGVKFDLTREHMINIMLNFGNRSNIDKFTRGYAGKDKAPEFEARLWEMFDKHATKEDWDFVQKIGSIFEEWRKETETLYYNLSGVTPKWLDIQPFQTRHGEMQGWYFPIIYDKLRSNIDVIQEKKGTTDSLFQGNYTRATTSNRHTRERTGYTDRIEFQNSIEQVASRMQQVIHDISYRPAVMNAGKVIYDKDIRAAIRKHYGSEYEAQLSPWLKDIANHFNQNDQAISFANAVLRRARFNLMAHALGMNLRVILSPDVGALNPKAVASVMGNLDANTALAWEKSKEIPHSFKNMDRDFRERLEHTVSTRGWDGFQSDAVRFAYMPLVKVSQGFRIVTFVDTYKKALARGLSDSDAAALGDSAVRERHGSGGVPDIPAIMRGNEAMRMSTVFYGFFNAMYNWQRQLPNQVRRREWKEGLNTAYGSVLIPALFGAVLFNKAKEDDSWFKTVAKALALQPLQTIVFVREFANYFIEGYPPRTPIESIMSAVGALTSDVKRVATKQKPKKPIQNVANVVGLTAGLPLAQPGRTGQFLYDVKTGEQKPRNILEWARGIISGEARLK